MPELLGPGGGYGGTVGGLGRVMPELPQAVHRDVFSGGLPKVYMGLK